MIRHVVFFTAKNPADREVLFSSLSLLKEIGHARVVEVARNFETADVTLVPDVALYTDFDSVAQRGAFKAHPLYKRVVEIVNETRDVRIAVDFIGGGD